MWEDAKLKGIDFRAAGNEPVWYLEITAGKEIVFVSGYGQSRYVFATPAPLIDQPSHTTTYTVQDNTYPLTIVIEGWPCQDSMSGEPYETTVTVVLDGKIHRGCGKALH